MSLSGECWWASGKQSVEKTAEPPAQAINGPRPTRQEKSDLDTDAAATANGNATPRTSREKSTVLWSANPAIPDNTPIAALESCGSRLARIHVQANVPI